MNVTLTDSRGLFTLYQPSVRVTVIEYGKADPHEYELFAEIANITDRGLVTIRFSREMRSLSIEEMDFDTLAIYTVPHSES